MSTPKDTEVYMTRRGERGSQGGYFPQYEEFAIRVYDAMVSGDLEEIRVADMEENVGKLDDIVYVTSTEVHAYQVKWTTAGDSMSYLDFIALIPGIAKGWKNLKRLYSDKTAYPKLLTNKLLTDGDYSINDLAGKNAGGFVTYECEVLKKLKNGLSIDAKWSKAVAELEKESHLASKEWDDFRAVFSFIFGYKQELIEVADANQDARKWDIVCLNRRIQELVSRSGTENPITYRDLIAGLGWASRFETFYDHNLVVPEESYVPNSKGLAMMDAAIQEKTKGYVFLKGSPGSGKSTLLTQWVRDRVNPSVRFYAFDFLHPSSQRNNDSSRGNSTTFLNDIVKQIHKVGIQDNTTLPPIVEQATLKTRFYSQLENISENFKKSGIPFIILVDGLDHITREYKGCVDTLMEVLPAPNDLPEGVIFVLGSQHFDQLRLNVEVEKESKDTANLVVMPPLSKDETEGLCKKLLATEVATDDVREKCWRKSQGHPLYLRYLLNQIAIEGTGVLEGMDDSPEGVEDYYARIIGPMLDKATLRYAFGLISRIAGAIRIDDVRALCEEQTLLDIKRQMWHLFRYDKAGQELSFFHNSFRQYLLNKTAEDVITEEFDKAKAIDYYKKLAAHFKETWDRGYYLYKAEEYDAFVSEITPEHLYEQLQNYRPLWSVRRDMERGVDIGRIKKDPYLLVRYMLLENQLSQMGNQDYSVLTIVDEFIASGRGNLAKVIIREGRQLHCSQEYSMELAVAFLRQGDQEEANLLFELSYPTFLARRPEEHHNRYRDLKDKIESLTKWVETAAYFISWEDIEKRIAVFIPYLQSFADHDGEEFQAERCQRRFISAYLTSLIAQERWTVLDCAIRNYFRDDKYRKVVFDAYEDAIVHLSETTQNERLQNYYFDEIEKLYDSIKPVDALCLRMSYLAMKAGQKDEKVASYIEQVPWKRLGSFYQNEVRQDFSTLNAHIFYVKTRARLGIQDRISDLVPEDKTHEDNDLMVSYVRRVFSIAQMAGKAQASVKDTSFLPLVKFCIRWFDAYANPIPHNRYSYTLLEQRADFYEFLIESAKSFGDKMVDAVAKEFENYFGEGSCGADAKSRRAAVMALFRVGYDKEWCIEQMEQLEITMLELQDVDGRERENWKQGQAWLKMGHWDRAEICFHHMIEESFGIGYRKDYQPSLFAEWAGAAIERYPEKAVEYIHWVTSRLKHIESVAESRTRLRAAETLLENVLKYNLRSGLKLAIWLLDSEYDYFQSVEADLLAALLREAKDETEYSALFKYYTELYLYTDDNDSTSLNTFLLRTVVESGRRILSEGFDSLVPALKNRIATECPESITSDITKALDEILNSEEHTKGRQERERDKVLAEAKSLLAEGRKEDAWAKTMEYLSESSASGWARYYDGGSRINACEMLLEIDKERGRKYALELFAQDIPTGYSYGAMQYLDEILPLLTDEVDEKRLHDEELAYMNRIMREDTVCESDKPDIEPDDSGVCEIMRDWLLYLAKMPVVCVAERAKMLLAHLYNESDIALDGVLPQDNQSERLLLEIGCYLVELKAVKLSDFAERAKIAAVSPNYQYRVYAKKILEALDEEIPLAPYKVLPATYSMSFPETSEKPLSWLPGEEHESEVNWRDASSIMGVASHWCGYLAYCSGIDRRTLNYRAVELMKQYGDTTEANVHEDVEINRHYDTIALRYSYKKAFAGAALDGMLNVAAELKDGKAVRGQYLDSVFVSRDFKNILIKARKKPNFIQRIADPKSWTADKNWLNDSQYSERFADGLPEYEGCIVIGEYCHIKKMGDKLPIEEYQSKISLDYEEAEMPPNNSIFGESPFMHDTSAYLSFGWGDPELILLRGGYYTDFSNKSHWIALNPAFAAMVGLSPCEDGYFAWRDADGEKVVESVYWQSGNINGSSRDHYEASEGWMVVMKKELFEAVCEMDKVYIHKMVMRRYSENLLDTSHKTYRVNEIKK